MPMEDISQLDDYDVIQLTLTCLSGVSRQITVTGQSLKQIIQTEGSISFPDAHVSDTSLIYDTNSCSGPVRVDLTSIRHLPWRSRDGLRVGGAMCELTLKSEALLSPRAVALRQVLRLQQEFSLTIKSAVEAECMIFEADGITPLNNVTVDQYARCDFMAGRENLLLDTCQSLEGAGLPVQTFMSEFSASQYEVTFRPQEGVDSADTVVLMKEGLRSLLGEAGLVITFMPVPTPSGHANGFHLNHSLWTLDGTNAFVDDHDAILASDTLRHWIAGLIHHAPALTAFMCPTVNCYRRLDDALSPTQITWGVEDRSVFLRLKTEKRNVYLENRLPSAASNSYAVLAGTIAAGMDGLAKKLECPPQNDPSAALVPHTMQEAMDCLEKDSDLKNALGNVFCDGFLQLMRRSLEASQSGRVSEHQTEREIYFHTI